MGCGYASSKQLRFSVTNSHEPVPGRNSHVLVEELSRRYKIHGVGDKQDGQDGVEGGGGERGGRTRLLEESGPSFGMMRSPVLRA